MIQTQRVIVVEGKYDAARLANLVQGTILTTDGFRVMKDRALQQMLKRLARARGLIVLTDSDAAGFRIRHFVTGLVGAQYVAQAYVPAMPGKEPRKAAPGKEGLLGVEGIPDELLLQALEPALQQDLSQQELPQQDPISYYDLYEWGISGGPNSAQQRRALLRMLGLPPRLSKKELLQVLNTLYTRQALYEQVQRMQTQNLER